MAIAVLIITLVCALTACFIVVDVHKLYICRHAGLGQHAKDIRCPLEPEISLSTDGGLTPSESDCVREDGEIVDLGYDCVSVAGSVTGDNMREEGEIVESDMENDCMTDTGNKIGNDIIDTVDFDITNTHKDDCGNMTKDTIVRESQKIDKIDEPTRDNKKFKKRHRGRRGGRTKKWKHQNAFQYDNMNDSHVVWRHSYDYRRTQGDNYTHKNDYPW